MASPKIHPAFLIGAAVVAVGALGFLTVSFVSMRERSDFELCKIRLKQLDLAIKGGALLNDKEWEKAGVGRAFLADRHLWPARRVREVDLSCPVLDSGDPDAIDYRGPAVPLPRLAEEDPMCSDRSGNHGPELGGNVLLKNGGIYAVDLDHPLWARAAKTTTD